MATDSSHRVIMGGNGAATFSGSSFLNLQVMRTYMIARRSSKFGHIRSPTAVLAAL